MKPDIIRQNDLRWIDGHVGVFCSCGKTLYIKNLPEKAGQEVRIECPCGQTIRTIYAILPQLNL